MTVKELTHTITEWCTGGENDSGVLLLVVQCPDADDDRCSTSQSQQSLMASDCELSCKQDDRPHSEASESLKSTTSDVEDGKEKGKKKPRSSPSRDSGANVSGKMAPRKTSKEPVKTTKSDKEQSADTGGKKLRSSSKSLSHSGSKPSDSVDGDVQIKEGKTSKSDSQQLVKARSKKGEKRSKKSKSSSKSLRHTSSKDTDKVIEDSESEKDETLKLDGEPVKSRKSDKKRRKERGGERSRSSSRSSARGSSLDSCNRSSSAMKYVQPGAAADEAQAETKDECSDGLDELDEAEHKDGNSDDEKHRAQAPPPPQITEMADDADEPKDSEEAPETNLDADQDDNASHHLEANEPEAMDNESKVANDEARDADETTAANDEVGDELAVSLLFHCDSNC